MAEERVKWGPRVLSDRPSRAPPPHDQRSNARQTPEPVPTIFAAVTRPGVVAVCVGVGELDGVCVDVPDLLAVGVTVDVGVTVTASAPGSSAARSSAARVAMVSSRTGVHVCVLTVEVGGREGARAGASKRAAPGMQQGCVLEAARGRDDDPRGSGSRARATPAARACSPVRVASSSRRAPAAPTRWSADVRPHEQALSALRRSAHLAPNCVINPSSDPS